MVEIAKTVDASGLACPMPIVRTKMAMNELNPGDVLKVISTDRGSCTDMPAWAEGTGNRLIDQRTEGDTFIFLLEKA